MKVFISWSGERSHFLGNALRDWLPLVLDYVDPWLSQADIEAGQRWAEQVSKELENTNFGVLCITRDNASSAWVLFEAGALAKSMQESRVIPLLLDLEVRDITGPLAQFQAKKFERTGVLEVVQSLNNFVDRQVPSDRLNERFDALWPRLEKKVAEMPKPPTQTKHVRPQNEILEELVTSIRSLDARFNEFAKLMARVQVRDQPDIIGSSAIAVPASSTPTAGTVPTSVVRQQFSHGRSKAVVVERVKRRVLGETQGVQPGGTNAPAVDGVDAGGYTRTEQSS